MSLRNNRAVFDRIRFKPRTLVDVSKRSQEITLFGNKHKMPIVIAPTGTAGLLWYEGEIALARKAARDAGIPFTLATGSMTSMEQRRRRGGRRPCGSSSTCGPTARSRTSWSSAPRPPATRRWW